MTYRMRMNIYILFLTWLSLSISLCSSYLNGQQMVCIRNILKNPGSDSEILVKTRECLAYNFIPFAFNEFHAFAKRNTRYMKNINYKELRQYAIIGLCNAAKKYNGTGSFNSYSKKYILGSLHDGLTILSPLKTQTKYERLNGFRKPTIVWGNSNEEWLYSFSNSKDSHDEKNGYAIEKIEHIKNIISTLSPFEQRLFYYKYCKESFREIRTTSHVCELMVITDSYYHKIMPRIMNTIKPK